VAAVLTPPDVVSQLFLAAPLLILYGISILVSYVVAGRKRD
jgi:sec-independent protein translocase protein TatC